MATVQEEPVQPIEVQGYQRGTRQAIQTRQGQMLTSKDTVGNFIAIFIIGTFALSILLCFVYLFILVFRSPSSDMSSAFDLFKTVSSVLSGPLGFVLGFYFRQQLREKAANG